MLSYEEIVEEVIDPAVRELQNHLRQTKVVLDQNDRKGRNFKCLSLYFSIPDGYTGDRIEDINMKRALSQRIFLSIQEWYGAESGGINEQISGIGISHETDLYINPPDWEAMANDLPAGHIGYCLDIWFVAVSWPNIEIAIS